jgi:hypothetical protein
MTKLTLSVEEDVVEKAKHIAAANKTSVSAMFSQFVHSMADSRGRGPKIGPLTRKLTGVAKLPPGKDYKEVLADALAEKYGVGK